MSRAYLVLEGQKEIRLLEQVLPQAVLEDVRLVDGRGKYGAEFGSNAGCASGVVEADV